MKQFGSFVVIENAAEWAINRGKSVTHSYWLFGAKVQGLPDTITKKDFPLVFKRIPSFDPHSADTLVYMPIDEVRADLISSIEEYISLCEERIADVKNFLAIL